MGEYLCRVADASGRVSLQVEAAASEGELRRRLAEKGLFVYSVRSRGLPGISWHWRFQRRRGPSPGDFLLFNQQLMTLARAGLPILQALDLLAKRAARPSLRDILDDVRERVRGGAALSDAFRATGLFSEVYTSALLAGERSGNLVGVLEQYIAYSKITSAVRRRIVTALVYPALLVVVAAGILSYITLYVIPRFAQLYDEMNVALPTFTVAVVSFATHLRGWILLLVIAAVAGTAALVVARRTDTGAQAIDRAQLRLPIVGAVLMKFRLAQFCRTLATLLTGGIPLVTSLQVSAGALSGAVLRNNVETAAERVSEGESLHAALAAGGVIPPLVTEMVEVGESTGALPQMLGSVAEFYEEELDTELATLMALIEPLLLVFMGGVVLTILVALYLPIFSIGAAAR